MGFALIHNMSQFLVEEFLPSNDTHRLFFTSLKFSLNVTLLHGFFSSFTLNSFLKIKP